MFLPSFNSDRISGFPERTVSCETSWTWYLLDSILICDWIQFPRFREFAHSDLVLKKWKLSSPTVRLTGYGLQGSGNVQSVPYPLSSGERLCMQVDSKDGLVTVQARSDAKMWVVVDHEISSEVQKLVSRETSASRQKIFEYTKIPEDHLSISFPRLSFTCS